MAPFGMGLFISAMGIMEMKKPEEIADKFKDVSLLLLSITYHPRLLLSLSLSCLVSIDVLACPSRKLELLAFHSARQLPLHAACLPSMSRAPLDLLPLYRCFHMAQPADSPCLRMQVPFQSSCGVLWTLYLSILNSKTKETEGQGDI